MIVHENAAMSSGFSQQERKTAGFFFFFTIDGVKRQLSLQWPQPKTMLHFKATVSCLSPQRVIFQRHAHTVHTLTLTLTHMHIMSVVPSQPCD